MVAQLVLQFDTVEELQRMLEILKTSGLYEKIRLKSKPQQNTFPPRKRLWKGIGSVNLGGKLDHINLRDYAYED